jgi:hypothetical protein
MLASTVDIYTEKQVDSAQLPAANIRKFKIFASIFSQYPTGELILADPDGRILSNFAIRPGTILRIVATDMSAAMAPGATPAAATPEVPFTRMIIVGVENRDREDDPGIEPLEGAKTGPLGGNITVHLAHPWAVLNDNSNHAYQKRVSEIIKGIATSAVRGFSFDGANIRTTDDSGAIVRYKLQETESEFILNKLLPYATINSHASYAFVDERNVLNLQSFLTMYNQDPKLVIIPPMQDAQTQSSLMLDFVKTPGLRHSFVEGAWFLGRSFQEQMPMLKRKIYIENIADHVTFVANTYYHSVVPGYTLIRKDFVASIDTSEAVVFQHRNFEDALRLNSNILGVMNEFFEVSVTIPLAIDVAQVGKTAILFLMNSDPSQPHWANGKWVIVAAEHFEKDGVYFSKLLLAKPSIPGLPTAIEDPEKYLKDER